jgi:hypothetical protein
MLLLVGRFVDYHSELLSTFQNWKMIGIPKAVLLAPLMFLKTWGFPPTRFGGGGIGDGRVITCQATEYMEGK